MTASTAATPRSCNMLHCSAQRPCDGALLGCWLADKRKSCAHRLTWLSRCAGTCALLQVKEPRVLYGGGWPEMRMARAIEEAAKKTPGAAADSLDVARACCAFSVLSLRQLGVLSAQSLSLHPKGSSQLAPTWPQKVSQYWCSAVVDAAIAAHTRQEELSHGGVCTRTAAATSYHC